jgi:hypothetical protein
MQATQSAHSVQLEPSLAQVQLHLETWHEILLYALIPILQSHTYYNIHTTSSPCFLNILMTVFSFFKDEDSPIISTLRDFHVTGLNDFPILRYSWCFCWTPSDSKISEDFDANKTHCKPKLLDKKNAIQNFYDCLNTWIQITQTHFSSLNSSLLVEYVGFYCLDCQKINAQLVGMM